MLLFDEFLPVNFSKAETLTRRLLFSLQEFTKFGVLFNEGWFDIITIQKIPSKPKTIEIDKKKTGKGYIEK